ncbi:MAG: type IV pilus assembly protein PilM [Deltaproteobacteria bacterium]|nr:type IV pilus assembly protein PilM [Deltaproteobacteria bacterium]
MAFWKTLAVTARNPFRTEEGFVALDIGSSSVKLLEAEGGKGAYRLLNLGTLPLPPTAVQNNMVSDREAVVKAVRSLIQANGIKATKVVSAVPGRAVIIRKIQLPIQEDEELDANVEFEANNVIPESLENVNLDYQVLDYLDDGKRMDVLLVAVKKDIIRTYTDVIEQAGLSPAIIDVDYFALENMHELSGEPAPGSMNGLIHIGARYTTLNVLRDGVSTYTGDLPLAGEAFTEAIMQKLHISYDQAETYKVTGLLQGGKNGNLAALLRPICDSLADEIVRTLRLFGVMAEERLTSVQLSGGSAKIPGLAAVLEGRLGVPVKLCDPFRGFSVSKNVDRHYLEDSAPVFAVGAGLCTRRPGDK